MAVPYKRRTVSSDMPVSFSLRLFGAVAALLLLLLPATAGKSMVRLSGVAGSYSTSSTLAWVTPPKDGSVPPYAVHVGQEETGGGLDGRPVWCRGQWHNTWITGELDLSNKCVIAFVGSVFKVVKYDILVSLGGAARLKWMPWDKHMAKPENSLMTPNRLLVMVYGDVNGTIHTGNLGTSIRDRTAKLYDRFNDLAYEASKVLVLVEIEPVRYSLTNVQLDTLLDMSKDSHTILSTHLLTNERDQARLVSEEVAYTVKDTQYWGRVKGTVSALPAAVYPSEGDPLNILWGVDTETDRVDVRYLQVDLPAGTAVNATIIGKLRHYEAPYFGTIRAYYDDHESRTWRINSFHSHNSIVMVVVQYSQPFYLRNGTVVENTSRTSQLLYELTTTTTTTTTTPTTTTTTTTTTTPSTTTTTPTTTLRSIPSLPPAPAEVVLSPESLSQGSTTGPYFYHSDETGYREAQTYTENSSCKNSVGAPVCVAALMAIVWVCHL